jgi:hypothetical protein
MMQDSTRGRASLARRLVSVSCIGSLALQIGCYSYLPVQSELPRTSERISVSINDVGRVLLAERVGPTLDRIEGRLVSADSASVVLSVSRVTTLRGVSSRWLGEDVTIPRQAILAYQARPFSRSRTFALAAAIVGGLIALALSISLAVGGNGTPDPVPIGGGTGQG